MCGRPGFRGGKRLPPPHQLEQETEMSLSAISTTLTSTLSSMHSHGRRKGGRADLTSTTSSGTSSIGQLPAGVSTSLFSNLVQSFQQSVGASSGGTSSTQAVGASNAAAASIGAPTTPAQQQEAQAFMHSLVQALKQEPASANGGSVTSSLQSLIQQLGPDGKSTAATQTLASTFQNLVNGAGGSGASGTSTDSSNTALRSFLTNLMQNVQTSGTHSLSGAGSSVNAHV
jgi:hypothetical protein